MAFVAGMGNEALFFPRDDLDRLLKLPRSISAVLVSAMPRIAPGAGSTSSSM